MHLCCNYPSITSLNSVLTDFYSCYVFRLPFHVLCSLACLHRMWVKLRIFQSILWTFHMPFIGPYLVNHVQLFY